MARLISIKPLNTELPPLKLHETGAEIECKVNQCDNGAVPCKRSFWKKFTSSLPRFHRRSGSYDVNPPSPSGKTCTAREESVRENSSVANKRSSWKKFTSSLPRFHRSSGTYYVNPPPSKCTCPPIQQPMSIGMQLLLCYCPCILIFTYVEG